jgi:hypothetical protein
MPSLSERLSELHRNEIPLSSDDLPDDGCPSGPVHSMPLDDGDDAGFGISDPDVELAGGRETGFQWAIPVEDGWLRFSLPDGITPESIGVDAIRADETD